MLSTIFGPKFVICNISVRSTIFGPKIVLKRFKLDHISLINSTVKVTKNIKVTWLDTLKNQLAQSIELPRLSLIAQFVTNCPVCHLM